jgi:hypothetical protein
MKAGRKIFTTDHKLAAILAGEGALFTLIITLSNNNNHLFASRLGATSYELGLISSLPPIVGMICLIPFAIITDRMKNKKSMVIAAALLLGTLYFLVGLSPLVPENPVAVLIFLLIMINFPMSLYGSSWQSFFSDVALPSDRNQIYAHRTKMNTAVGIVFPLLIGLILTAATGVYKITVHQIYYFIALPLALGQVLLLRRIPFEPKPKAGRFRFSELGQTALSTFRSRSFLGFLGVALLVYIGWQMDWSVYFLAQFRYLELNEVQLSLVAVLSALTQFLMLGVWTQISSARGVRFVFVIGAAGFAFCSLTILFAMMMPPSIGIIFYYVFHCIGSSTFSAFQLSLLLCLLEVIPNVDKTLSIAIYSTVILMSNAVMPFLGVHIYNLLGENRQAMIITIGIVSAIRIAATIAALVRYYVYKNRDDLLPQK